jgi:hypothetical protein
VSSKYGQAKVIHVLYVDQSRSQHGCEIFLETVTSSTSYEITLRTVRSESTGTAAVLEGRTARLYGTSTDTADWDSSVWHMAVHEGTPSLAQIQMIHVVVGGMLGYTLANSHRPDTLLQYYIQLLYHTVTEL